MPVRLNALGVAVLDAWKTKVKALKREVVVIAYAARDPRTPLVARLFVLAVVAYTVSPIDLIPDFVPVLGYLDELLLLPLALLLAVKLIPKEALDDARARADGRRLAPSWAAAAVIIVIWMAAMTISGWFIWRHFVGV